MVTFKHGGIETRESGGRMMTPRIERFAHDLRTLEKAYREFARATPTVDMARRRLDGTFDRVMRQLEEGPLGRDLDILLDSSRTVAEPPTEAQINQEARLLSRLTFLSVEEVRDRIRKLDLGKTPAVAPPANAQELEARLRALHEQAVADIEASRAMARRPKKDLKRAVLESRVTWGAFAGICFVGNTMLPAMYAFSNIIGGAALGRAFQRKVTA